MCDSHANALINIVYLSPSDAEDYLSNIFDVSNLIFFAFPKVGARYAVVDANVRIPWAVLSRSLISARSLLPIVFQLSHRQSETFLCAGSPLSPPLSRTMKNWWANEVRRKGGKTLFALVSWEASREEEAFIMKPYRFDGDPEWNLFLRRIVLSVHWKEWTRLMISYPILRDNIN